MMLRLLALWVSILLMPPAGLRLYAQSDENVVTSVAWSSDGRTIAIANYGGYLQVLDAITGDVVHEFQAHSGIINTISWSPDSTRVATASPEDKVVRIWNANTGEMVAELEGDSFYEGPAFVAWNPNGNMLVSVASVIDGGSLLHFWRVEDDQFHLLPMSYDVSAYDIAWSLDGLQLAVADYRGIYIFEDFSSDILEPRVIAPFHTMIGWSSVGAELAALEILNGVIDIIDVNTGQVFSSIQASARTTSETGVSSIAFSPIDTTLITDGFNTSTQIWDTTTGELIETITLDRQGGRFLMSLSPYGGRLALGNSAPASEISATQSSNDQVIQTFANGAVQIVVPDPSIERLRSISELCDAPPQIESDLITTLDQVETNARPIDDFIVRVETLPQDALPPGCAADLLAVVQAIAAEAR